MADALSEARRELNARLPWRSLVGFVAATVAVFLILVLSYRSYEERTAGVQRLMQTLTLNNKIESLLSTLTNAETGQRGFLLTGSESYLEPYRNSVVELPRVIEGVRRLVGSDVNQLERLDKIEFLSKEKIIELKETIDLRKAERFDEAQSRVKEDRGKVLMDRMRVLVDEMKVSEQRRLEMNTRDWEDAASRTALITWLGAGLLFALIGGAAFVTSKDFREQQAQSWLRAGQSELGTRLQGEKSYIMLGDEVLRFLATYLGARLGAIYLSAGGGVLKRIASYALPADASTEADPSHPAAGLVKQALTENRILSVTDIPAGYFPISSGLGKGAPRQFLLAPVAIEGKAIGVVELAFFRPLDAHDLQLLERVADPIGVAFRSARYRAEVQDLLEETQRQAEELQTQQEELRVNNEELEQQSRTLQQSQEQLKNQQAELETINAQLEEQTLSLAAQRDDLAETQVELQRASTYKSEFLANMSHELRTPLNSTLILAKLLADNGQGNLSAEQVKFARTIYSAGNDLLTLINDILDLSRIEAGKLPIRLESVALPRLVDDLSHVFQPLARDKKLDLDLAIEPNAPTALQTDPTRLQQILTNLLSNAIKFTERGGVSLRVQAMPDGGARFDVKDTGIGIPRDQQQLIFDPFRQADGTTNRKYGGTGLGLSISRDLARLLGGELTVESRSGAGSTFTLVLPSAPPAEAVGQPRERANDRAPSKRLPSSKPPSAPIAPGAVPDDRDDVAPGSRAILIVEDDPAFARILVDLAHELDFKALAADTAEQGLVLARRYRPSAIVLDVSLPDRSGLTVLDALKHEPLLRHVPVHVISVSDYAQTALAMGAAGYAIKPVKRDELSAALKRLEAKFTQELRRVLVVEDDAVLRDSTCRLLATDDVETVAVGSAREALEALGRSTFDCMVLDLSLPDRTGFELLEEMAGKENCAFPPVIVYTGRALSRDEEQQLRRFSSSIIIKGARSPERLLDEVTLFLHQVESKLPPDRQRMLRVARDRDVVFDGRRVLVVEDDVRNIFALSSVLEPKGAKVEIARNGIEALDHLARSPGVDLVLMDLMMPEMDGLQAIREIRKQASLAKLPIIALTAKAMADDRENALTAGANDYIAKPLDVDKLLSLLRVWMPK